MFEIVACLPSQSPGIVMVLSLHELGGTFLWALAASSECILVELEEAPFHSLRPSWHMPMGGRATLSVPRMVAALGDLISALLILFVFSKPSSLTLELPGCSCHNLIHSLKLSFIHLESCQLGWVEQED